MGEPVKAYTLWHEDIGIWLPSTRTTENGVRLATANIELNEKSGWRIVPVEIHRLPDATKE
jgi:hypothetical protein